MFCVIYQWKITPGKEEQFIDAWGHSTEAIFHRHGSNGSRMHKSDDGTWIASVQWPDRQHWEQITDKLDCELALSWQGDPIVEEVKVLFRLSGVEGAVRGSSQPWVKPVVLKGRFATLVPLSYEYHDDLVESLKDGELWKLWYTFIPEPEKLRQDIEKKLRLQENGLMMPFAVVDSTGKPIGMTTFMNIDSKNRGLEIGSTWYRASVQRSGVNTECKLMLLTHAFEKLQSIVVQFRTSFFNHQSRQGIERLGAKLDGILRNQQIMPNQTFRDMCVYSIIEGEWPSVKAHLNFQLDKHSAAQQ